MWRDWYRKPNRRGSLRLAGKIVWDLDVNPLIKKGLL